MEPLTGQKTQVMQWTGAPVLVRDSGTTPKKNYFFMPWAFLVLQDMESMQYYTSGHRHPSCSLISEPLTKDNLFTHHIVDGLLSRGPLKTSQVLIDHDTLIITNPGLFSHMVIYVLQICYIGSNDAKLKKS